MLVSNVFFRICYNIFLPVLPLYYHQIGMNNREIGFAIGSFAIGAASFRFLAGKAADHFGCWKVQAIGACISISAIVGYLFVADASLIAVARFMHGIGEGAYGSAALTAASLLTDGIRGTEAIAVYTLSTMIGSGIAISSALLVYEWGNFNLVVYIGLCAAILSFFLFPKYFHSAEEVRQWEKGTVVRGVLANQLVCVSTVSLCLISLCYSTIITFLPGYVLQMKVDGLKEFYGAYALTVILSRLALRYIGKMTAGATLGLYILLLFVCLMVLLSVFLHPVSLFLAGLLLGVGFGLGFPTFVGIVAERVEAERRGATLGVLTTGYDFGQVIGSMAVGLFVSNVGYAAIFSGIGAFVLAYVFYYRVYFLPQTR